MKLGKKTSDWEGKKEGLGILKKQSPIE